MIELILSSKYKRNLSLKSMAMIGRQNLHLSARELDDALQNFQYRDYLLENIYYGGKGFADALFSYLGAKNIESIDASDFEDASIIQDMNYPLSTSITKGCHDIVLDSGTLEHVFNFPQAIQNCMELIKTGGHFLGIYPCNNFFGHGFYQFSSELFYRIFSKENGFEMVDAIVFVDEPSTKFYSIPDTSLTYQRMQLTNSKPAYIYVLAQKISDVAIFKKHPIQMDYAQIKWKGVQKDNKVIIKKRNKLKRFVHPYFNRLLKALLNINFKDSNNFKKPFLYPYEL